MKTTMILMIPIIFLVCCMSSTRLIQHTDSSTQQVNTELKGKTITLVKINEEEIVGEYVGIVADSIMIGAYTIGIDQAREIQIKNQCSSISMLI